jgi:hypothetical protein
VGSILRTLEGRIVQGFAKWVKIEHPLFRVTAQEGQIDWASDGSFLCHDWTYGISVSSVKPFSVEQLALEGPSANATINWPGMRGSIGTGRGSRE